MRRKINSSGADDGLLHRDTFDDCPNCGHIIKGDGWEKLAHTLVLTPRYYKCGCASIVSECPVCFQSSWVHMRLAVVGFTYIFPKSWQTAAHKRIEELKKAAKKEWAASLCSTCKHLEGNPNEFNNWRHCIVGTGGAETQCSKYAPSAPPKPITNKTKENDK